MISDGKSTSNLKNLMLKVSLSMINLRAIKWNSLFLAKTLCIFKVKTFWAVQKRLLREKFHRFIFGLMMFLKFKSMSLWVNIWWQKKILNPSQVLLLIQKIWNMLEDWLRFLLMCITSKIIVKYFSSFFVKKCSMFWHGKWEKRSTILAKE